MARPGFYTCGVIFPTSTCSDLQYSTRIYIACTCLRNVRVQTRFQFHAPGCFFFFPCTVLYPTILIPNCSFVRPSVRNP